jgi:hypothetical protein
MPAVQSPVKAAAFDPAWPPTEKPRDKGKKLLIVSMIQHAFGNRGLGGLAGADTRAGTYTYNDGSSTRRDHEGRVFAVPKHFPAVSGMRTEINLFAGTDITDMSNWSVNGSGNDPVYLGDGIVELSGFDGGFDDRSNTPNALGGESIDGLDIHGPHYIRARDSDDVGKTVTCNLIRASGGAATAQSVTITLTADWQAVVMDMFTGTSSNEGVRLRWWGGPGTPADGCQVKDVTTVSVTNRSNQTSPLPIPLDTPHEYARELYAGDSAVGSGDTDGTTGWSTFNSPDTFESQAGAANGSNFGFRFICASDASASASMDLSSLLTTGKRYVVRIDHRAGGTSTAGEDYRVEFASNSNLSSDRSPVAVNDTDETWATAYYAFTYGANFRYFGIREGNGSNDCDAMLDNLEFYEAATGIEQFSDTNGNTVVSGVITAASGDELSPWHWETVRSGSKKTIRHKVRDHYTPWSATDSVVANERRLPSDWMTNYNRQLGFYADGAGTTGGTEPDWSTATEPGDTVSDNGITWTAFWCTIRGLTLEPAATNTVTDSDSLSTLGNDDCTITPDAAIAPDGSRSASLVVGDGTGTQHRLKKTQSVTSGATWTSSIYCKDNGDDETLRLLFWNGTSSVAEIRFRPSTGTVTETNMTEVLDYTVEGLIDGWYRLSVTVVTALTGTYTIMWYPTMQSNVTEGMYLWGAQINSGHYTSRIKTTAGTVTRTTQEAAMTYPIENFDNDNFLSLVDMSFGVALQDISATQSLISTASGATSSSVLSVNSSGKILCHDGSSYPGASPSDVANELFRIATHHQDGGYFGQKWLRATDSGTAQGSYDVVSFDGGYSVSRGNIALCPSISIPVTFHGVRFMPGLDIQTADNVTQYHSFDDLRYV